MTGLLQFHAGVQPDHVCEYHRLRDVDLEWLGAVALEDEIELLEQGETLAFLRAAVEAAETAGPHREGELPPAELATLMFADWLEEQGHECYTATDCPRMCITGCSTCGHMGWLISNREKQSTAEWIRSRRPAVVQQGTQFVGQLPRYEWVEPTDERGIPMLLVRGWVIQNPGIHNRFLTDDPYRHQYARFEFALPHEFWGGEVRFTEVGTPYGERWRLTVVGPDVNGPPQIHEIISRLFAVSIDAEVMRRRSAMNAELLARADGWQHQMVLATDYEQSVWPSWLVGRDSSIEVRNDVRAAVEFLQKQLDALRVAR